MVNRNAFSTPFVSSVGLLPQSGQIKARYLRGFAKLIESRGGCVHRILERHNIAPELFADPDQSLDCSDVATMMEYCASRFEDPIFGLRLSEMQDPDVFGAVTVLARSAPTLRTALQAVAEYLPIMHSPEGHIRTVESEESFELRWNSREDLNAAQQPNYQGTLLLMSTVQMLAGQICRPTHAAVSYKLDPRARDAMERRLGCPIGQASESYTGFNRHLMDMPLPSANGLVFELLGHCLREAKTQSHADLVGTVRAQVRGSLRTGNCSISRCARTLRLSVRSLQKQLAAADTSFSGIVETERMALARDWLGESTAPIETLAHSLGYSDQSCFGRAFRRWTGTAPAEYRRLIQERAARSAH